MSNTKQPNVALDSDVMEIVQNFAKDQNLSEDDAIKKLVATAHFFYGIKKQDQQAKIYVANANKSLDEISLK